ncbi:MAG: hypothetical protein N2484_13765 [Clostridia bacterium]|nr:hypothetical protein [Clostridia bacterium]
MNLLVFKIGNAVFLSILQLTAGYLSSVLLYSILKRNKELPKQSRTFELIGILFSSTGGILLPLGPIGAVPILATALKGGVRVCFVLPLLISSVLINTSVLLTEADFFLEANINRIILAFVAGAVSGIVAKVIRINVERIFRGEILENFAIKSTVLPDISKTIRNGIYIAGPYIILGAAANVLFHTYLFFDLITWFFSNPSSSFAAKILFSYNAPVKPLFLLAASAINILFNLLAAVSLMIVLNVRGFLACYIYYSLIILLLVSSIFII